jgi:hypothetical protein
MPIHDRRYYPDELELTWANLASQSLTWANGTANWSTWTTNSQTWTFTSNAIDLGISRAGYPISSAEFDRGSSLDPRTCTISYLVSTDNITYTAQPAGVLVGRYIKTRANITGSYLERIETVMNFDTQSETFTNVNTASLSGTVNGRLLPVTQINLVTHVSSQSSIGVYGPNAYDVDVLSSNSSGVLLVLKDLDTWGKANVDVAGIDFTVQGFPRVTANATLGIVSIT